MRDIDRCDRTPLQQYIVEQYPVVEPSSSEIVVQAGASTSASATAAVGAGTDAGGDAAAAKAAGGGGSAEGERRSLRAGGRRSSGGFGSFSGAAALLLHGSSPLAGGDGGVGGADAVVGPCVPMARDWTEVVPSHDEARFRRCLAESRSRGGVVAGRRGFYLQRDGDIDWEAEVVEREKERRRAAAGLEVSGAPCNDWLGALLCVQSLSLACWALKSFACG